MTDRLQTGTDHMIPNSRKKLLISGNETRTPATNRCNSVAGFFVRFIRLVTAIEYSSFSHSQFDLYFLF